MSSIFIFRAVKKAPFVTNRKNLKVTCLAFCNKTEKDSYQSPKDEKESVAAVNKPASPLQEKLKLLLGKVPPSPVHGESVGAVNKPASPLQEKLKFLLRKVPPSPAHGEFVVHDPYHDNFVSEHPATDDDKDGEHVNSDDGKNPAVDTPAGVKVKDYLSKIPYVIAAVWIQKQMTIVSCTMLIFTSDPNNLLALIHSWEMMELQFKLWVISKKDQTNTTWFTKLVINLAEDKELALALKHKVAGFFLDLGLQSAGLPPVVMEVVKEYSKKYVNKFVADKTSPKTELLPGVGACLSFEMGNYQKDEIRVFICDETVILIDKEGKVFGQAKIPDGAVYDVADAIAVVDGTRARVVLRSSDHQSDRPRCLHVKWA